MKCIEDKVIPKHIKGDDRERILDVILKNNDTQIQVDSVGNTFVSLCSSTESLVGQVRTACLKLNIPYSLPVCSKFSHPLPLDAKITDHATYVLTHKTLYGMTEAEKAKVLDTVMSGWGASREGVLIFTPKRNVVANLED